MDGGGSHGSLVEQISTLVIMFKFQMKRMGIIVWASMLIENISVIIVRPSDKYLLSISFIIYSLNPTYLTGVQWLSGRVLDSRRRDRGVEPHWCHCVVSLSKNINPSLVLVQPRKTLPFITE